MTNQNDFVIDNGTGLAVRTDIQDALQALAGNSSGNSEPSVKYAYQWWADSNAAVMKLRNSANDGWIELFQLDGTLTLEDGSASTPALAFRDDLATGIYSDAANTFNVATAGVERMQLGSETVFNETGVDVDFRVEGDTDTNLLYVNAGEDRVAIGANTVPTGFKLAVNGDITLGEASGTDNTFIDQKQNGALELINSGIGSNNAGMIRINRYNDISGGTTAFRDTTIYNGKNSQMLFVDGSASRIGIGSGATSPSFMLDVQDATDNCLRLGNTNDGAHGDVFAAVVLGSGYYHKAYMAAHSWEFYVNGSSLVKRFEMQSGGDFKLNDGNVVIGAAGHGIDFSDNSSAPSGSNISELLDYYEEGTWIPVLGSSGGSAAGSGTYTNQHGTYTRVGNNVNIRCYLGWNSDFTGAGGNFAIALPYTANNTGTNQTTYAAINIGFMKHSNGALTSANQKIGGYVSGSNVLFYKIPTGQASSDLGGNITNATWSESDGYVQFNVDLRV